MNGKTPDAFIKALTQNQLALRGYIRASIGNQLDADDVVQKTNMILWKKSSEWDTSTPFLKWAFTVARFEILAHFRDKKRDRLVFDQDVIELMSEDSISTAETISQRVIALRSCLSKLKSEQKQILADKYVNNKSILAIAKSYGRSENGIKSLLLRIRKKLNICISTKLQHNNP